MSRVMIDKRGVAHRVEVILQDKVVLISQKKDDFINLDFSSQTARIKLIVNKYYQTQTILVSKGDCIKLYRRYPLWLFIISLLAVCYILYVKQQDMTHYVLVVVCFLLLDKNYAYTMKKTTSNLAMG